jgi:crossover junction endodeoxyribonuclease RuvC
MQRMSEDAERPEGPATRRDATAEGILGIDPGLQGTGYAIVTAGGTIDDCRIVEAGVIRLNPRQSIEQRLVELERSLDELIAAHRPTVLACEQLYAHYKHPRTAILMAHARGVVLAVAARRGLAVLSVAATHVKKLLTGNGHAGKAQIQRAIAATLRLPEIPEPHDVADALAIALCGLRMRDATLRAAGQMTGVHR